MNQRISIATVFLCAASLSSLTSRGDDTKPIKLEVGGVQQLKLSEAQTQPATWATSDASIAKVYSNGFVIGMKPGVVMITVGGAKQFPVNVGEADRSLADVSDFKQYPNNEDFKDAKGRRCVGTELNAHLMGAERSQQKADRNRVQDFQPISAKDPFLWQLAPDAPIYDGTGVLMGHPAPIVDVGDHKVPATKINYGMSKIIHGDFCVYAFSVTILPSENIANLVRNEAGEAKATAKGGKVGTSAWVPLDKVMKKESLLENVGVGLGKLPRLPLDAKKYIVTGGNPDAYLTPGGKELSIIPNVKFGAVPSHYLRRPSGTVNIEYCVPGFGLGGQNVDSVLITSRATFQAAKGVRQFVMPTYYPVGHPQEGKISDKTQTFIYGALEAPNSESVYGWIAKEALADAPE